MEPTSIGRRQSSVQYAFLRDARQLVSVIGQWSRNWSTDFKIFCSESDSIDELYFDISWISIHVVIECTRQICSNRYEVQREDYSGGKILVIRYCIYSHCSKYWIKSLWLVIHLLRRSEIITCIAQQLHQIDSNGTVLANLAAVRSSLGSCYRNHQKWQHTSVATKSLNCLVVHQN